MQNYNFITKFSEFFVKNIRFTLLLLLAIFLLGIASYTTLLKREGFPSIQFPIISISGNYLVNDKQKVEQVTSIIEQEVSKFIEVKEVNSVTTDNTFQVTAVLFENAKAEDVNEKLLKALEKANLPESVKYFTFVPNPSKFENEFDLIISLYSKEEITPENLQLKAQELTKELIKINGVVQAKVIPLIQEQTNPITGQKVSFQQRQNIISIKEGNEIKNYTSIQIGLIKREGIDVIKFSDGINNYLKDLQNNSKYKDFGILSTNDFAPTIKNQISSLEQSTLISLLVIVLIISLVINIKSALIVGFTVILVLTSVMTGLLFTGNSLNVISLFGLILVLGMFVDDAIVIVEAIAKQRAKGLDRFKAIKEAINEVGISKIGGSITTILVFIPMFFITGILGNFIRLIPTTVIMTLIISLILSLTVVAAITVFILKKSQRKLKEEKNIFKKVFIFINQVISWENPLINTISNQLGKLINWYLKKKLYLASVIIISIILISIGFYFARKLEFNIFPESEDADVLSISISKADDRNNFDLISQKQTIEEIEKYVIANYTNYINNIVWTSRNQDIRGSITLEPKGNRDKKAKEIAKNIENEIKNFDATIDVSVTAQGGGGPQPDKYPFKMQVYVEDQKLLEEISNLIKNTLKDEIKYTNKQSQEVKVQEVTINNLGVITKLNSKRYASVEAKFDNKVDTQDITNIQNIVKSKLSDKLKNDYNLDPNEVIGTRLGTQQGFVESFNSAIVAFFISLIAMYAYLVLQYNSFSLPLLVYAAIPFTFPLLFPGLYLLESPLSFFITLALITLSGVVVNNSIIFVDYANSLLEKGNSLKHVAIETVKQRFRPIIATSLTTILGLLPVAITDPFWRGLASAIMLGLFSSTILVLLIFPAYYYVFQNARISTKTKLMRIK